MREQPKDSFFARLFCESRRALHRYVRRFVDSADTADEIVQEAFLRTYEQRQDVVTPRAFLFTTARNLAANLKRNQDVAKTDLVEDLDESLSVIHQASLEERALADEEAQLIKQAAERLPPRCRAAFALRVFHGYSYKEIAQKLDISVKTVEKYIARGLDETHAHLTSRYREAGRRHD
jgi:RNA polymerase sigma-70 factor, ECF subfamily